MDYKFYIDTGNRYEDVAPGTGDPSDHNNRLLNVANTPTHQYCKPSFGQLATRPTVAGNVPVSWLGRPGVHLQTTADLASGSWQDLMGTDGAS
jgi:hypothetical protein